MKSSWFTYLISITAAIGILFGWSVVTRAAAPTVTVYVSEDQVFSEPILKDFEREMGIEVEAVFDTEEAKSTGVMNRLIAEKHNRVFGNYRGIG
jgi:iron(III) transport system substrate-binding protein